VGTFSVHVDEDQTYRYRDASGDKMPIHVDDEVARSVGLPGIIAHGLCTMAMCSQAVIATVAGGDPTRLRRLAVRFAANVFPGNDVVTTVYEAGEAAGTRVYAFEAVSNGALVVKHGLAEVV
jgi:acyl dehydratase